MSVTGKRPELPSPLPRGLKTAIRSKGLDISPNVELIQEAGHKSRWEYDGRWRVGVAWRSIVTQIFLGTFDQCAAFVLAVTPVDLGAMAELRNTHKRTAARELARAVIRRSRNAPEPRKPPERKKA